MNFLAKLFACPVNFFSVDGGGDFGGELLELIDNPGRGGLWGLRGLFRWSSGKCCLAFWSGCLGRGRKKNEQEKKSAEKMRFLHGRSPVGRRIGSGYSQLSLSLTRLAEGCKLLYFWRKGWLGSGGEDLSLLKQG